MAPTKKVSTDQVLDALGARPGTTAAELADSLGLGQSTAAKHLAALEADGAARRQPGGREGARRLPDRWYTAGQAATEGGDTEVGAPEVGGADVDATPAETASAVVPEAGDSADAAAASGGRLGPVGRLGRGALGELVRAYLAARGDEDLGPTQIAKGLGRSQGAVANALGRLEAAGVARLVSTSPRRYRIASEDQMPTT
ncbi:MAG: MarR family transcriptional regulator [Acidimicrobiales bacterium]